MLATRGQAASHGLSRGPSRFLYALGALALLGCAACSNPLKPRIDAENRELSTAKDKFNQIRAEVEANLKKEPDLFRAANVTAAWRDRFQSDQEKLNDAFADLEKLKHRDSKLSLFSDVERMRNDALSDATAIQTEARRWLDLKNNTTAHVDRMKADYEKIKSTDVSNVVATLEKAQNDWPAKKADLEGRLESLKSAPEKAEKVWSDVQQAAQPKADGKPDYAALMKDEMWLDSRAHRPEKDLKLVSELYQSRDVLLENLDRGCRAELKVVSTHITDVDTHQSTTETKQKREDLSATRCDSLKNDIGMDIEHKSAGTYDSETQYVPQPPGFAYMAPPGQSNQYGRWESHNGASVWTWLPEYLILREMLWGPRYVPVPSYEWEGYWSARRNGTTYYGPGPGSTYSGNQQVQSAPKYGTHGTFTANRYGGSRYQNQGGSYRDSQFKNQGSYRSSGYANGQSAAPPAASQRDHQFGRGLSSGGSSRRFGSSGGSRSAPSGRRFGRR